VNIDNIRREHFGEDLKILVDTERIYYITELKASENSVFPETAVANTREYQVYFTFAAVRQEE
jgi:hypothetical protein